ncbi:low temperature requirement protein A [Shinella kummerowiae]|uniref:low temperature requirement protein A n=1 Tax=Shinella kummerowiae TaxID=417745 RepID=UPI0021B5296D|nr:low temperature requirement protein A [Shinella kummerowiae]MCT7663997.1 low temperature requirement protein A [Shinella kummerowiae]
MTALNDERFAESACLRARGTAKEGKVAFAELFFDLVFVLTIIQLSHSLAAHYSPTGLVEAAVLMLAVWWLWIYTTWATNWLDPDKAPVRILLFVLMFLGLMLSIAIPTAFGEGGLLFALTFIAMQVGRSAFTAYVMRRDWPENSLNFTRITAWTVFSALFWLAGAFVEHEARLVLWLVALAIDYLSPALGFAVPGLGRSTVSDWEVSGEHMAERCALFVIICLGETILVTGRTVAGMELLDGFTIILLAVAFLSTATMWWIYFRFGHGEAAHLIEHSATPGRIARMAFTYAHIPIVAGIVLSAVAEEFALAHPHGSVDFKTASAIIGGPIVFLAGNIWFKAAIRGRSPLSHLVGIAALLCLSIIVPIVEPYQLFMAAAVVLFGVALWEFLSLKSTRADDLAQV